VVHDIPSPVDIQPIAAVDEPSHTLSIEVLNQTRQGQTIVVDLRAHKPSRLTATLRQCADGRYSVEQGTVAIAAGRVKVMRLGLSILQVIVPVHSP
jgi:hypothetical protein